MKRGRAKKRNNFTIIESCFRTKYFRTNDGPPIRLNLFRSGVSTRNRAVRHGQIPCRSFPNAHLNRCYVLITARNATSVRTPNPDTMSNTKHSPLFILFSSDSALISGIGSNMSLPSCIPQDQEFLPGQTGTGRKTQLLLNNRNQSWEKNEHEAQKQRPNFLPLAPVGTGCVSVNTLDPMKGELFSLSLSPPSKKRSILSGDFVCWMQRSNG